MNNLLPLLWVTTFIWFASAGPLPQRYRRLNHGTKFLNAVNTRSRRTTATTTSTLSQPLPSTIITTATKNSKRVASDNVEKLTPTPARVPTDVIVPAPKKRGMGDVAPGAKNASGLLPGENETASSLSFDGTLNYNYDYDYLTFLYDLEFFDLENETNIGPRGKQESTVKESLREGRMLNNELFLKPKTMTDQKKELIKELKHRAESRGSKRPRLKAPRPFRYTTPSPDQNKNDVSKEPPRNKTTPPTNQKVQNSKTEASNPTAGKANTGNSTVSLNSSSSDPHIKAGWTAESSVSVEVRVESSYQGGYKIPHHYFVSVSEAPIGREVSKKNNVQAVQSTKNNMRLREVLELEVSATPKIVDLRPGITSTERARTTSETTTTYTTMVVEVKEPVTTTTERNLVVDETTTASHPAAEVTNSTSESLIPSRGTTTSRTAPSRRKILNTPTSPVATRANISQRRSPSTNSRSSPMSSRYRNNRRGRPPSFLVPRQITSQLGINPYGLNPSGITPFGIYPQGIYPLGLSPYGRSPLGLNNTRRANVSAFSTIAPHKVSQTKENQTTNSTDAPVDEIKEERYHVQVKKPDGSINGDYVVLNPNTGSLSGVRYEAIDGADQDLIQQALLSFLSLDPRLDPRPKSSQNSLSSQISTSSSAASRQEEIKEKLQTESNSDSRSQRPKKGTGLLADERINGQT